ncbi:MAG: sodium:alanine symporter family protein [Candidatus Ancillula sp.]|jgi:AGCS family alanine or glycine:cation symporter|nr:sodium:alanine symporter family protein [Candidatus Ancillula sp.]
MEILENIVNVVDDFLWGAIVPGWPIPGVLVLLLVPTGVWLSICLRGIQFTRLGQALHFGIIKQREAGAKEGDVSHFQALCTALSATVGTGNIVGVATAIGVGGPGALFWMWVTGLIGMATKYTEAFLGCKFRETDENGEQAGGPQVYLKHALKGGAGKFLAKSFAVFTILAAVLGIGNMTQVHSIASAMDSAFGFDPLAVGWFCMIIVGLVIIGGVKRIGSVASFIVPIMIVVYMFVGAIVLFCNFSAIPAAFAQIFHDAFCGTAAVGGFLGSSVVLAVQKGMSRGVFSNESGLGTGGIAASSAISTHPVKQGLVSMTQTFIDTLVVVTFTGLVIITTGVWHQTDAAGKLLEGSDVTSTAFNQTFLGNIGPQFIAVCLAFFAITTVFGWGYYGERCAVSLFGIKASMPFRVIFTCTCIVGATLSLDLIWTIADVANGLMALPNLIGLLILSPLVARETKKFLDANPKLSLD